MRTPTLSPNDFWKLPSRGTPYVLRHQEGAAAVTMGQAVRILAGAEQSGGDFSVCLATGPQGDPVPLHWHAHEHDTFLCLRGGVQVWADGQSRVLPAGGFASVPPGVRHSYRFFEPHTEMIGIISPGGFEGFFAQTGWRFDGSAYPAKDDHPTDGLTFADAGAAYDVHFVHNAAYEAPVPLDRDGALPGGRSPYFLRPGHGDRFAYRSMMLTTICTAAESAGRFGMSMLEGGHGAALPTLAHRDACVLFHAVNGSATIRFGRGEHTLHAGDSAILPAGTPYRLAFAGRDNRVLAFAGGDVLARVFAAVGQPWTWEVPPESSLPVDEAEERQALATFGTMLA